jgi:fibro-slime domain-containing protein
VTYYDFRGDSINPDFGTAECALTSGMVQETLDVDRKPLLKADLCSNGRLNEWFRPSGGTDAVYEPWSGRYDGLVPHSGRVGEWVGTQWDSTYEMANIVVYDSLPFVLLDSVGAWYVFSSFVPVASSPLDGRGFGEDPPGSGHNYGYSMELRRRFIYEGGEYLNLFADGDTWMFLNGKLAVDHGGTVQRSRAVVDMDEVAAAWGIVVGQLCVLDVFCSHRTAPTRGLHISGNLISPETAGTRRPGVAARGLRAPHRDRKDSRWYTLCGQELGPPSPVGSARTSALRVEVRQDGRTVARLMVR